MNVDVSSVRRDRRSDHDWAVLATCIGIVAGQFDLTSELELQFSLPAQILVPLQELAEIVYQSSAVTQGLSYERPSLVPEGLDEYTAPLKDESRADSTTLLWSGGKDALVSSRVLRDSGYSVECMHFSANPEVAMLEARCAIRLGAREHLEVQDRSLDLASLIAIGRARSKRFGRYPRHNAVPHGRDLILAAIAAISSSAGTICAGYERDLYDKYVWTDHQGFPRHDVQSSRGANQMDQLLQNWMARRFFSPIAGISEYVILRTLFDDTSIWKDIQSCFWDHWCGECSKCLRYALVQASIGATCIEFRTDPFINLTTDWVLALLADADRPFREEQIVALSSLDRNRSSWNLEDAIDILEMQRIKSYLTIASANPLSPRQLNYQSLLL